MYLLYLTVYNEDKLNLLKLTLKSLVNTNFEKIDIIIITSSKFNARIQKDLLEFDLPILYYIIELKTKRKDFEEDCNRLKIFEYKNINRYKKILFIENDVLINRNLYLLFNEEISDRQIYGLIEGNIGHEYWGSMFFNFSKYNKEMYGFSHGVLFFSNSDSIKELFKKTLLHIEDYVYTRKNTPPKCFSQPFIVFNSIIEDKYNNTMLRRFVEFNPSLESNNRLIYRFPGGSWSYPSKHIQMNAFLEILSKHFSDLDYKEFSWEKGKLTFLQNGIIHGFGGGKYKKLDSYNIQANFGKREHILLFNENYTEFTSTRKGDGNIVKGKMTKDYNIENINIELPIVEYGTSIPRIIYQTWASKDLSPDMENAIKKLKDANHAFEHKLFDDDDCREFIAKHYPKQIVWAYDKLIPGAYKADLWRYCILYIHGGIYLDIKYVPVDGFSFEEIIDKEHLCKDRPVFFENGNGIYNAIIITQKGNRYLEKAINKIWYNCFFNNYNVSALHITGPGLLSEIVPVNYPYSMDYKHPDEIVMDHKTIFVGYPTYRDYIKTYNIKCKKEHYSESFGKRRVYAMHAYLTL